MILEQDHSGILRSVLEQPPELIVPLLLALAPLPLARAELTFVVRKDQILLAGRVNQECEAHETQASKSDEYTQKRIKCGPKETGFPHQDTGNG